MFKVNLDGVVIVYTETFTIRKPIAYYQSNYCKPAVLSLHIGGVICYMYLPFHELLRGLSPRADYTDRAAAAGRRS